MPTCLQSRHGTHDEMLTELEADGETSHPSSCCSVWISRLSRANSLRLLTLAHQQSQHQHQHTLCIISRCYTQSASSHH